MEVRRRAEPARRYKKRNVPGFSFDFAEDRTKSNFPIEATWIGSVIAKVQTGTGNRIEFWDNHGTPLMSRGQVRRYFDIGRLTKGR